MEQGQNIIPSGSSSSHGEPLEVDYRELMKTMKADQEKEVEDFGGLVSSPEVADLTGLSRSHARHELCKLRQAGKVRGTQKTIDGAKGWWYSAKDVYEIFKGSGCLSSE